MKPLMRAPIAAVSIGASVLLFAAACNTSGTAQTGGTAAGADTERSAKRTHHRHVTPTPSVLGTSAPAPGKAGSGTDGSGTGGSNKSGNAKPGRVVAPTPTSTSTRASQRKAHGRWWTRPSTTHSATPAPVPAKSSPTPTPSARSADTSASRSLSTPRCLTSALEARVTGDEGAAGTDFVSIALTNTGDSRCQVRGYPSLALRDANHRSLDSHVTEGGPRPPADPGPSAITVAPGASASFTLTYSSVPSGSAESCPTAHYLRITPPEEFAVIELASEFSPCQNGALRVTAFVAGTHGVK